LLIIGPVKALLREQLESCRFDSPPVLLRSLFIDLGHD